MAYAKVLVVGTANAGKTSLLKSLDKALVISRDGKPFPFEMPHVNVPDYNNVDELINLVAEKMKVYKEKYKEYPKTIVFDSVSRIFTDIETNCSRRYKGFDVWSNVNSEVNKFVESINSIVKNISNVVIIAHATWDEKAGRYVETCKGSFAKIGGFLSTVDYAVNIDVKPGIGYFVTHRGNSLSRTLIGDIPDSQPADEFNLQEYLDKISSISERVAKEWSL